MLNSYLCLTFKLCSFLDILVHTLLISSMKCVCIKLRALFFNPVFVAPSSKMDSISESNKSISHFSFGIWWNHYISFDRWGRNDSLIPSRVLAAITYEMSLSIVVILLSIVVHIIWDSVIYWTWASSATSLVEWNFIFVSETCISFFCLYSFKC